MLAQILNNRKEAFAVEYVKKYYEEADALEELKRLGPEPEPVKVRKAITENDVEVAKQLGL